MKIEKVKKYLGTPFSAFIEAVENRPGTWNSTKVSIYRDDNKIGEYLRNYSNFGHETFYPFSVGAEWYALYSPHYTATRVLKLHEDKIEDWCGEDPKGGGFCPTEFFVPRFVVSDSSWTDKNGKHYDSEFTSTDCSDDFEDFNEELKSPKVLRTGFANFGFLSGCIWGDDSSWKLRYINLKEIPNKVLTITEAFGYWELPASLKLNQCISLRNWEEGETPRLQVIGEQYFAIKDDK